MGAIYASLSGTAQSPWFLCMYGLLESGRHLGELAGKNKIRPLFLLFWFFCLVEILLNDFWGLIFWHFWAGRARHPGPPSQPQQCLVWNFLNVGGWLTHGDLALDAGVDFLAVAEHRLIPARVRSEWSRLKDKGLSSMYGLLLRKILLMLVMRELGLLVCVALPLPCLLLLLLGSNPSLTPGVLCGVCFLLLLVGFFIFVFFMVIKVLILMPEQLALTDQLFDAALGELYVAALGQPCLLVGDFNVEPTKIPCLAKGISAGLWVDFGEAWALAAGLQPAPTCKRSWEAVGGYRRDFMFLVVLIAAAAALLSCSVQLG